MADIDKTIDAVWRIESAKLIAGLTRITRDVGLAEDLAQDALVAALERWPEAGIPDNPGAWLMATAKHRAIDHARRGKMLDRTHQQLGAERDAEQDTPEAALAESMDDEIGDDLLRLVFIACHPVLPMESRVALTLRLLGGLTTDEIARAFLVPVATMAQRIVRAKRTLAEARVPFEVPRGRDLEARVSSVLQVIYLVFNEGYTATAGEDWIRPSLCEEAMRLGRIVGGLMPGEAEVHGLVALMEIQASRLKARSGPNGEPILLMQQDRMRWDRLLINRGLAALQQLRNRVRPDRRSHQQQLHAHGGRRRSHVRSGRHRHQRRRFGGLGLSALRRRPARRAALARPAGAECQQRLRGRRAQRHRRCLHRTRGDLGRHADHALHQRVHADQLGGLVHDRHR